MLVLLEVYVGRTAIFAMLVSCDKPERYCVGYLSSVIFA